jgi:hypothetical protein
MSFSHSFWVVQKLVFLISAKWSQTNSSPLSRSSFRPTFFQTSKQNATDERDNPRPGIPQGSFACSQTPARDSGRSPCRARDRSRRRLSSLAPLGPAQFCSREWSASREIILFLPFALFSSAELAGLKAAQHVSTLPTPRELLGVYVAPARLDDTSVPVPVERIAQKIASNLGREAVVLVVSLSLPHP